MPVRFLILLRMTLSTGKNTIDLVTKCTRMLHRSNPQIVASGCKLHCADGHLGEKEAHKFIKEVVRAGKVNIPYLASEDRNDMKDTSLDGGVQPSAGLQLPAEGRGPGVLGLPARPRPHGEEDDGDQGE